MKLIKNINIFLWIALIAVSNCFSQGAPQGITYQAVARDFTGEELADQAISVRLTIKSGSAGGDVQWIENHTAHTNKYGLFTLTIGQGTREGGLQDEFSDIQWGDGIHFLKVAIKFRDDGEYLDMGTTQFMSVPYALYAEYAASGGGGNYGDPDDHDKDPTNEIQSLSINTEDNELLLINNDGSEQSSLPFDFEIANEIQDLLLEDDILEITNNPDANQIDLDSYLDNTDNQTLSIINDSIRISGGNKVSLEQFYDNTDNQTLSLIGDSIGISGGNKKSLAKFYDNTDNQTISLVDDSIRISGGNAIDVSQLINPQNIYFYADKTTISTVTPSTDIYLIFNEERVDEGSAYNHVTGTFSTLASGLYSFYFIYTAKFSQKVSIYVNNGEYDLLYTASQDEKVRRSFMLFLTAGDIVNMVVNSGLDTEIGEATLTGFKVY